MSLDLNALKEDHARLKEQGGRNNYLENFVKMPDGKGSVTVRLLPPAPEGKFAEKGPFYQWTRIHRVNGKSLHDPRHMVNGKWIGQNPIGDYLRWLWKESENVDVEEQNRMRALYREIKPIERYYYNCIVREEIGDDGGVKKNVGPKILSVGKTLHQIILRHICGDEDLGEPALGDVTDPKKGRDFKIMKNIVKSGQDSFPKYDTSRFLDESPLGNPEEVKTWMDNLHDLTTLRVLKSADELDHELKCHLGLKNDDPSDFDPSQYQKSEEVSVTSEPEATVEDTPDEPEATTEATEAPAEDGEVMADDVFMKELKEMGA